MATKAKAAPPADLLVELLTEELPPKSLKLLSEVFAEEILNGLVQYQLKQRTSEGRKIFATPRRLATLIPEVAALAQDRASEIDGPNIKAPPEAVAGFARKHGVEVGSLQQKETPKGSVYVAKVTIKGASLEAVLAKIVAEAVKKLPIPKMMRWGDGEAQFVRPVHGLVMLHGKRVVKGEVLGLKAGNRSSGHRFLSKGALTLKAAADYEKALAKQGKVIADFATRRNGTDLQLQAQARKLGASLGEYQALLDEVTALVEFPVVYAAQFDAAYLAVPQECLELTLRKNQKYFPLLDGAGKLQPRFLIVSNMQVADPRHIIGGNERVVRPRLEDARFFYDQDRKQTLEARVPRLEKVVYQGKLGSQLQRTKRLQQLAGSIAAMLGADRAAAERAAWLAKADLLTGMVGEFPELQGVMGRYYALHDGEPREVADAIEAHYRPRFAGDRLPDDNLACSLALADKLDALAGLFGAGERPTGDKDPFGLRRAALGVVRILVEKDLPLSLFDLVGAATGTFGESVGAATTDVQGFILERFAGYLKELGYSTLQVDAVLALNPVRLSLVPRQLEAVKAFQALPESESLSAANKRVANILRQAAAKGQSYANAEREQLKEPAEIRLYETLGSTAAKADKLFDGGDYTGYLKSFSILKTPVDEFFESVMVMVDEEVLRKNRLALLADLRRAMNRVADIARLAQ